MNRVSGPHHFPGGFYHLLAYQKKYYGLELRLADFAAWITLFADEGLTVIVRSPCCVQDLSEYPISFDAAKGEKQAPYRCSYCGSQAALPGIVDTWWQCGSIDTLPTRLEYYFETWSQANPLASQVRANEVTDLIIQLEPHIAILRGFASAWPREVQ